MALKARSHYETLGLTFPVGAGVDSPTIDAATIRKAYHTALLRHHPDKSRQPSSSAETIDDIVLAYAVLASPDRRKQYDNKITHEQTQGDIAARVHAQAETFDLDDFDEADFCIAHIMDDAPSVCDPETNPECLVKHIWYRGCRCEKEHAYVVTESLLNEAANELDDADGEVLVQCLGCSTWIRVLFATA
ncbi:hypothetical protein V1512DRAFT_263796 [Lipomyces arxii]|uniref:uncharacterized protein n=1 Tax=Lipomyces arxii TaxID=56418 RepID=UPI0034CFBA73